ncbi:MAG: hypothetical protein N3F09_05035 [Bacteroidia bacterium]|nr:hypothetical protein [Bacteroidia bacterium]
MKILGVSAFYHDSAVVLLNDGRVEYALQEERFTRKKHDASFPLHSLKYIVENFPLDLNELNAIVFYDKPWLKFERLLENYYAIAPKGFWSFYMAMPVWLKEKIFLEKIVRDEIQKIKPDFQKKKVPLLFTEHHLSHAASTFFPSGFEEAAILTVDGVGEWATASMAHGKGHEIKILKELHYPHSVGLLYSSFTYFLGFKVNSGEYKLMGLAPYGNENSTEYKNFKSLILKELVHIYPDGSLWMNQKYFNYMGGLKMIHTKKWEDLFGLKKREPEDELQESHCHLALAIQHITEDILIRMAKEIKNITHSENLCMAGGVALNCVANGKIHDLGIFKNIFITPASGDAGGALGAALAAHRIYFKNEKVEPGLHHLHGGLLGTEYFDHDYQRTLRKFGALAKKYAEDELVHWVARKIAEGKVVGWFQGRMEFGPRALGSRSILGDPRNPEMQKALNLKIKFRESFRPFAASVLEEDVAEYFEMEEPSPYMLMVKKIKKKWLKPLSEQYFSLPLKEKLYTLRSELPAITHVDFSCRIQTVNAKDNGLYYRLIKEFKKLTGHSLIINTSFNVRGEPIVNHPDEAYTCFMRTNMDVLVLGNYLLLKEDQPAWKENDEWKNILNMD